MSKINLVWKTGKTLTFGVYSPASVEREVGTSLPESPAASGRYIATSTTIQDGDDVVVKDSGTGRVVAGGEYLKEHLTWLKNG